MSERTYWRSRTLLKRGQVRLVDKSPDFLFFEVDEYKVKYARNQTRKTSCTCKSGSIYGVGKDCSHITAVKLWLKGDDING